MAKRVVLAYSGGLDTSVAVRWMIDNLGVEVVALAVNVGQDGGTIDEDTITERRWPPARSSASSTDVRDEFARDFLMPALKANALYEGRYPLVSALSRPVIAKHLVETAREYGADAVAHGCTGKGNDQVRFEVSTRALAPDLDVIAPVRSWGMTREDCILYAYDHGIPITATKEKLYSIDDNLWGRAIECGEMEDPWRVPPPGVWSLTKQTATEPRDLVIGFDEGVPVTLDGEPTGLVELISKVGEAVGSFGWGRLDMVENRRVGIKSRETYECPSALALIAAHADLESITHERDLAREKQRPRDPLRRAHLRRPVVLAAASGARRVHRRVAALRDRRRAAAPRARLVPGHRPAQRAQPLRLRPGHVRRRRRVPPRGLRRLRSPVGPRPADVGRQAGESRVRLR